MMDKSNYIWKWKKKGIWNREYLMLGNIPIACISTSGSHYFIYYFETSEDGGVNRSTARRRILKHFKLTNSEVGEETQ